MRWLRFAVLLLVVTIVQASLQASFDIRPDLLLVLLVFFSVHSSSYDAIITSFTIGLAADVIGTTIGPNLISFGLCGTALSYLNRLIAIKKMPFQGVAILLTGLLVGLLSHLLTILKGQTGSYDLYVAVLWSPLYSAVVGPFLFMPCAWLMHIRTRRFR